MQKLLLAVFATAMLFSCTNTEPETEEATTAEVAPNSGWATSHLMGKVQSIEETTYTPDSTGAIGAMDSCCIEMWMYNEQGFRIKSVDKDDKGAIVEETVVERLEDGKFVSATTTSNGVQVWSRTTFRDENGDPIYVEDRDTSGQVSYYYSDMTRNDIGQPLLGKMHSADSTFMGTWSRQYTDGMETYRDWKDETGTMRYERTRELNSDGWINKVTIVNVDDEGVSDTTMFTIVYNSTDEAGNWTDRTRYDEEGNAIRVEKRVYTYYE